MDPDTATAAPAAEADIRDDAGRYLPGVSGNPRGRPPGGRSALHLARALAEAGIAAVVIMERPGLARPPAARHPRRLAA
jgi:hypothetical protein